MDRSSAWKILLVLGIIVSLVAFILGWISFGVPDWHTFQRYNGSTIEYYGLWAYCQEQKPLFDTVCKRWGTAADQLFNGTRPNFIRTSEGLITTGMILLSLGLFFAIIATALPFLAYLAAGLAFIAFIFLVIGLPIFGRQSNTLSDLRGDVMHHKRYGFWLMVPTIVLEFLAIPLFLGAAMLYKMAGYGNIATSFGNRSYSGRQMLGPPNILSMRSSSTNVPYGMRPPGLFGTGGMMSAPYPTSGLAGQTEPSLLSQYLVQRSRQTYSPLLVRSASVSVLPQPSIMQSVISSAVPNVQPAYVRIGEPVGPQFQPIINLSGQTLIGPIQRTA